MYVCLLGKFICAKSNFFPVLQYHLWMQATLSWTCALSALLCRLLSQSEASHRHFWSLCELEGIPQSCATLLIYIPDCQCYPYRPRCSGISALAVRTWRLTRLPLIVKLIPGSPDWSQWPFQLSLSVCLAFWDLLLWCHCSKHTAQ